MIEASTSARRLGLFLTLALLALAAFAAASASAQSTWGPPTNLVSGASPANFPQFATSHSGVAVAAWETRNASLNAQVVVTVYDPTVGWSALTTLFTGGNIGRTVALADVAVDSNGLVAVLLSNETYDEFNFTSVNEYWLFIYDSVSGWRPGQSIALQYYQEEAHLAFAAPGELFVVRSESDTGGNLTIRAHHYVPGSGWDNVDALHYYPFTGAMWPGLYHIAADPFGTVALTWSVFDDTLSGQEAWGTLYVPGAGWRAAFQLDAGAGLANSGDVATYNGYSYFMYQEFDGTNGTLLLRTLDPSGTLNAPIAVVGGGSLPSFAEIGLDLNGQLTAVWLDSAATGRDVWGARWSASQGWSAPVQLDALAGNATSATIAADRFGGATAVWIQPNTANATVFAARYTPVGGWLPAVAISDGVGTKASAMVGSRSGGALAMWRTSAGGVRNITVSEMTRDTTPPMLAVDPLPSLTNMPVTVSGETEPGAHVFINGVPTAVDAAGLFTATFSLPDGDHLVSVEAYDSEGNWAAEVAATSVDTTCFLDVFSPIDGSSTDASVVLVQAATEDGALVWANGAPLANYAGGIIGRFVLEGGLNRIEIFARDLAGNEVTVVLNVTFYDPIPPLFEALANATAELAAIQAQLDSNASALANLQTQFDNATATLAQVQVDLAAALANGSSNDPRVPALQAQLALAVSRVAASEAEISQARAEAASAKAAADAAAGSTTLALLLGVVGAALGAVGLLLSLRNRGGGGGGERAVRGGGIRFTESQGASRSSAVDPSDAPAPTER